MASLSTFFMMLIMASIVFLIGIVSTVTGIIILATRAAGREVRTLAAQTTRLAQKGITDNIAGLVGNASSLLDAINQLVRTTAGIGVFLTLIGLILMGTASWLIYQIYTY
jgi:hypothetical protein